MYFLNELNRPQTTLYIIYSLSLEIVKVCWTSLKRLSSHTIKFHFVLHFLLNQFKDRKIERSHISSALYVKVSKMYSPEYLCLWHILDYSHKVLLGLCISIFGIVAIILNVWLGYAFIKSRLLTFQSHLFLLSLCIASFLKTSVTGFLFSGTSALAGRWLFGTSTCHLFAFLRQMLGVFQVVMLTFISVERFAATRTKRNGMDLPVWFYISGIFLSWLVAVSFSLPPLLGYGSYNCDVSGTICELDWRNLTPRQVGFNVLLLIFVGCVPIFIIFTCLWGVNCSDYKKPPEYFNFNQTSFTKTVTVMTTTMYLFWIPRALLSMWIFFQNLHPPRGVPVALSVVAPISAEAAEIIPALCYLTYDTRLRSALLEICDKLRYILKKKKCVNFLSRR